MDKNTDKKDIGRPKTRRVWPATLDEYPVQCPDCGSQRTLIYKKQIISPTIVKRMRECCNCGLRIPTLQEIKAIDRD